MLTLSDALFLDFDGTLAPIQRNADTVALPDGLGAVLTRLHARLDGALCLISGRDLDDLAARVPAHIPLIGNHGMARRGLVGGSETTLPDALLSDAHALADAHAGVRLERKRSVLALHYREAPDLGPHLQKRMHALADDYPGYRIQHGKRVIEAKPRAASKGLALAETLARPPFHDRRPVMIGDDVTDEAAFQCAQSLGGLGVKVGPGDTHARQCLADPAEVFAVLRALADSAPHAQT